MKNKLNSVSENTKIIICNIIYSLGIKGSSLIISLLMVPAYMEYFNNENILGVWFAIISIFSWILNFDLGIGNGLRNKLVDTIVKKDYILAKKYISSAYIFLSGIAIVMFIIILTISRRIPWNYVLNISLKEIPADQLLLVVNIVLISITLQFVLGLIFSIMFAFQKAYVPNVLILTTNLIVLCFINITTTIGISYSIELLAWVYLLAVNIPLLLTSIIAFSTISKKCKPNYKYFSKIHTLDTLKIGRAFLWIQLFSMILYNTNDFLITWLIGPSKVVEYQIYYKLFSIPGIIVTLVTTPIWSAVTKAQSENNYIWIKKLNNILQFVGLLGFVFDLVFILVIQFCIDIWLGNNTFKVNYFYAFIFAISAGLILWSSINSCLANGTGKLKVQLIFVSLGAIINIPIAFLLSRLMNSYISIVIANIISIMPYCIIQPLWFSKYINNKVKESIIHNKNAIFKNATITVDF